MTNFVFHGSLEMTAYKCHSDCSRISVQDVRNKNSDSNLHRKSFYAVPSVEKVML